MTNCPAVTTASASWPTEPLLAVVGCPFGPRTGGGAWRLGWRQKDLYVLHVLFLVGQVGPAHREAVSQRAIAAMRAGLMRGDVCLRMP